MVGGICPAHYRATLVKIIPYPMVDWHNAARVTDTDAYKLALLICLLPQTVNFYATYHIRQWRYDYRLRLPWLLLPGRQNPLAEHEIEAYLCQNYHSPFKQPITSMAPDDFLWPVGAISYCRTKRISLR